MQMFKRKWRFDVKCQSPDADSPATIVALAASTAEQKQGWVQALGQAVGLAASGDAAGAGAAGAAGVSGMMALESHPYLDIGRRATGS